MFETTRLTGTCAQVAQDGSSYEGLLGTRHVWLSDCALPSDQTTHAVRHSAHDEIWFVRAGRGQVWRSLDRRQEVTDVEVGMCLTIPSGTAFQFRTIGLEPFRFLIVQAPPWPEDEEAAFEYVNGPWTPSAAR